MGDPLTPTAGARYVLEREDGARYHGRIVTPDATYDYAVTLAVDAEPVLAPRGAAAPDELHATLAMFARLTARGADRRVAEGLPAWPERVMRWRGPGRGA